MLAVSTVIIAGANATPPEVNILKALQRLLRNEPIEVVTASHPGEALELIDKLEQDDDVQSVFHTLG